MYNKVLTLLLFNITVLLAQSQEVSHVPQLSLSTIKQVIKVMTLEEKVNLVVGSNPKKTNNSGPVIGDSKGKVDGTAGYTTAIPRLGIPLTILADGPAGVRIAPSRKKTPNKTYYATGWPVATLLASSWDTTLIKEVGIAFGEEIKEYGVDIILAPGVNIQRDPLNGRNFEYYSEDPYLSGHMASSIIQGIQSNGVGTCVKHFAANNQESNRSNVDAIVSERALREIYLRGFEIAVKNASPWTVMSSYNKLNGKYTSQNYGLLTTILRDEWGFEGYVMTDWVSGDDVAEQLQAGNDLIEPGGYSAKKRIRKAIETGKLDEEILNKNVEKILNVIVNTPSYLNYKYSDSPDLKAHALLSRKAASESMVLLKNEEETLPLNKGQKIGLFGVASYNTYVGGTGSGEVNKAYTVSFAEGIQNAGYSFNEDLSLAYEEHIEQDLISNPPQGSITLGVPRIIPELDLDMKKIEAYADQVDVALFTLGRNAGEGGDRTVTDNFNLTETEQAIIKKVSDVFHAKGKKIVIVINVGGVIETASWRDYADAILLAWQPGQEAGNALADVLIGKVNPSGKLAVTFPLRYEDVPSAKNFPGTPADKPEKVVYEEGIYVGYRYFNTFDVKPAYEFGYGLSYTRFEYNKLKLSSSKFDNELKVKVTVRNTGKVAGKEIVQLYLSAPVNSIDKPSEELKGFAKTALLQPGASQTITFILKAKDLASFNTSQTAWVADTGNYTVKIGASCEDIKLTKSFKLKHDILVEKVNKALVPQITINEIIKL